MAELTRRELLKLIIEDMKDLHKKYEELGLEQSTHMTADIIIQLKTLEMLEKSE